MPHTGAALAVLNTLSGENNIYNPLRITRPGENIITFALCESNYSVLINQIYQYL